MVHSDTTDHEIQLAAKDEEIRQLGQQLAGTQALCRQLKAQRDEANDKLATAGMQLEAKEQMIAGLSRSIQQAQPAKSKPNRQARRVGAPNTRKKPAAQKNVNGAAETTA